MSVRARSWLAGILIGLGMVCGLLGTLVHIVLFWTGGVLLVAGFALFVWAAMDVSREIGASHEKYDALLRAELPDKKKSDPS